MQALFFIAVLLMFPPMASAQATQGKAESPSPAPAAETRIDVDQHSGTVTIVVKGRPVALFDEDGLHVRNDLTYGGVMLDEGEAAFEDRVKDGGQP